jgi:hypothetical protein
MGNLSYSIRSNNLARLVDDSVLRQVAVSVQRRLLDANDKVRRQQTCDGKGKVRKLFLEPLTLSYQVAGNAIRSIGHLGHVLYFREIPLQAETVNGEEWDPLLFFRVVVESLSTKVERALMAVAFTKLARKNTLSWKERSVAKRHGWGACNSLSLLFKCSEMIREDGRMKSCCLTAFRLLTECIEKCWLLNEKVTLSAMIAIRALSTSSLTQVAGRSGLIGQACATCAVRLFEVCAPCQTSRCTNSWDRQLIR